MRIVKDLAGKVIATENITAAPASGLNCARDAQGVPVSEAGRLQEPAQEPTPDAQAQRSKRTPTKSEH